MHTRKLLLAGVAAVFMASTSRADLMASATQGDLSASATFSIVSGQLCIELLNTSAVGVKNQGQTLTGIFFTLTDPSALSGGVVDLSTGSSIVNPGAADSDDGDGVDASGGVSGEFGMETGAAVGAAWAGSNVVISNAGLGDLVGVDDVFAGENLDTGFNLDEPDSPDGINYGIISASGLTVDANNKMKSEPLINNGVVIKLDFTGSLADISNVGFNYGTDVNVIPAPGAALLAMCGMSLIGMVRRRL